MTLLQMIYIMEIYKFGSMNKAAASLYLSQSAISNAVREVEDELGVSIFKRNNKGVSLTDDGKELIVQIRPLVEQAEKVKQYYRDRRNAVQKKFSVSTQRYPFCAKAFVEFMDRNPAEGYTYHLRECDMGNVVEDVSSRRSDIGILFLSDFTQKFLYKMFAGRGIEFIELKETKPRIFISCNHPLAGLQEIQIEDIKEYPQVIFDKNDSGNFNFSEEPLGVIEEHNVKKIIGVRDRATAYNILANTNAFSVGTGMLPEQYSDSRVKSLPVAGKLESMCIGYIKIKDLPLSESAEKYLSILKGLLENVDDGADEGGDDR